MATSNFVVQFPLKTEKWQEDIINKRMEIGRQLYNALLSQVIKRQNEMAKTRKYRQLLEDLGNDAIPKKETWEKINLMRKEYRMTQFDFIADIQKMRRHYKGFHSIIASYIACDVWRAFDAYYFRGGKSFHFKRYGDLNTMRGSRKDGILFKDGKLKYGKMLMPVEINYRNKYECEALQNEIVCCRIVRQYVRSKYKYYVQITFEGNPPNEHKPGEGNVGVYLKIASVTVANKDGIQTFSLGERLQNIEDEKRRILRRMDRSRRAMNPDNYNEDGTIKKQGNKKVTWKRSNHYIKDNLLLKELNRKQAAIRKLSHEELANTIIAMGDKFSINKLEYAKMAKRKDKTEQKEDGRYKSKKRYGKPIANYAPAMLAEIITRKLKYHDIEPNRPDDKETGFLNLDHTTGEVIAPTSSKYVTIGGVRVNKDEYRAFLLMNSNGETIDINACNELFPKYFPNK